MLTNLAEKSKARERNRFCSWFSTSSGGGGKAALAALSSRPWIFERASSRFFRWLRVFSDEMTNSFSAVMRFFCCATNSRLTSSGIHSASIWKRTMTSDRDVALILKPPKTRSPPPLGHSPDRSYQTMDSFHIP